MKVSPAILLMLCSSFAWSNENNPEPIPRCSDEEINSNLVATRIFGRWKMDPELSRQQGNLYVDDNTVMTEVYREDNDVRLQFPLSHFSQDFGSDTPICAYSSGSYVLSMKQLETSYEQLLQFVLVSFKGNILMAFKPESRGTETKHRYQVLNLIPAPEQSQDLLFKSKAADDPALIFKRLP